VSKIKAQLAD